MGLVYCSFVLHTDGLLLFTLINPSDLTSIATSALSSYVVCANSTNVSPPAAVNVLLTYSL